MTLFTESNFEKMMIGRPIHIGGPFPLEDEPTPCKGCCYAKAAPCVGCCMKQLMAALQPDKEETN